MIRFLAFLAISGFVVAIGFGFLGFVHPAFDTLANFRTHFSIALIVLIVICIVTYGFKWALLSLLVAIPGIISILIADGYPLPATKLKHPSEPTYTLLHLNLFYQNHTPDKVIKLVDRLDPDIILFNEMSEQWKYQLKVLDPIYPYTYYCPEWRQIGGSKIYSRLQTTSDSEYCHSNSALALIEITIENQIVTFGSVHLRWPWPASGPRQVDQLEPVLKQLGASAIIAGDFNSVPWSWLVRRFAQYGELHIVGKIGPTWFHQLLPISWVKLLGLPIDSVMIKGKIVVTEARTLEAVGSDHLPVLVRFSIKQQQ
jgi:endonuclease/exonuclease/phosphatase (EEP) superfamily protein YafD